MDIVICPLLQVINTVLSLYTWAVILAVILSWLMAFNVLNGSNRFILTVADMLFRVTDPLLSRVRRFLPDLGGIDFSPLVIILALYFVEHLLLRIMLKMNCFV
ncbi:MAG: YggT family protein [Holosporales bacterium]